ncbi:MAG TPA: 4-hydroxybenzoate octaprenyltransferase [Gammaproteobacteria bacterium]|nr:4-hydroxybenzoate octaprenyltransferase [Gammaproteobacteria bacterium]
MNVAVVKDRLYQYYRLTRLDRPIGSLLLLWPAMWALWIAGKGHPQPLIVAVFVLGVFIMRSAGCVLNDYADRHIDPHVKRTQARPLAAGQVSPREALILFVVLSLIAFALVLLLNRLTVLMSFGGIALAAVYPFTKRYTHLPQVFLGAAFGWAVPMAFTAQTGAVPKVGWLLFIAAILWAVVYDTMYAMVDRDDDLKIGVKSTAILFGDADRLIIGIVQALLLGALVLAGQLAHLHSMYYLGLVVAAGLALYQQYLIRGRQRDKCFQAFLNNNWFGGVVFAGIVLHYMVISHI